MEHWNPTMATPINCLRPTMSLYTAKKSMLSHDSQAYLHVRTQPAAASALRSPLATLISSPAKSIPLVFPYPRYFNINLTPSPTPSRAADFFKSSATTPNCYKLCNSTIARTQLRCSRIVRCVQSSGHDQPVKGTSTIVLLQYVPPDQSR